MLKLLKKDLKEKEHIEKEEENSLVVFLIWIISAEMLESSPKFIFPEEKSVLVPYNKHTVKINCSIICAKGKKDNIVSTPDKWYPIVYITFVANVKDLLVTKVPFGLSMAPIV